MPREDCVGDNCPISDCIDAHFNEHYNNVWWEQMVLVRKEVSGNVYQIGAGVVFIEPSGQALDEKASLSKRSSSVANGEMEW